MVEVVVPLGALAMISLFFGQIFRVISHATLNRTIRKALDADPASARLLIEKLEPRARSSSGLAGWVMVVVGVAVGITGLNGEAGDRADSLQIAALSVVLGLGILLYTWWMTRKPHGVDQPDMA